MQITRSVGFKTALLLVGLITVVRTTPAQQQSGAWKLDAAKSKFEPGPGPKNLVVRFLADGNTVKFYADGTNADGSALHVRYDAKFDGKDYPVTGLAYADMVSIKRIDSDTVESVFKKNGHTMVTATWNVSGDGKMRTSFIKGTDTEGRHIDSYAAYERMDIACGPKLCEKECKGKCGNGANCDCPK